jgi:hypothetical protein
MDVHPVPQPSMPPFTVIIPTLNRCITLAHTLESCIVQQDENFRILVSDNHSTDETREVVESFRRRDPRITYVKPPRRLSMATHYEFAFDQIDDGFVMIVGSDDGLLPGAMARARECLQRFPNAKALHAPPCAAYYYPDLGSDDAGILYLRVSPKNELRNGMEWLERIGRSEDNITDLPMPYQLAWVHISVLNKIAKLTGRRIHSSIPDVFLSIAVASQVGEYVHVNPGFGIGAVSVTSNGAGTTHPKGDRSLEVEFQKQNEIPFHSLVGYSRSVPVLIGECLAQARDAGLLAKDFHIAWDRIVVRAYHQFMTEPWSDPERAANLETVRFLAVNTGHLDLFESARQSPSVREWILQHDFLSEAPESAEWEMAFDTRPLSMYGVHEAARLAETMMCANFSTEVQFPSGINSQATLASFSVLQQARQAAQLRASIRRTTHESERRAAERDRAKDTLREARAKQEKLREKLASK